jgi:hypothetical protein
VHQVQAEKKLGRKLKNGEEVDHKNGNRGDHSATNLRVMSAGSHAAHTNTARSRTKSGVTGGKRYMHSREYMAKAENAEAAPGTTTATKREIQSQGPEAVTQEMLKLNSKPTRKSDKTGE